MTFPVELKCPHCNSAALQADALAEWDSTNQKWSVVTTYDSYRCDVCQRTTKEPIWEKLS